MVYDSGIIIISLINVIINFSLLWYQSVCKLVQLARYCREIRDVAEDLSSPREMSTIYGGPVLTTRRTWKVIAFQPCEKWQMKYKSGMNPSFVSHIQKIIPKYIAVWPI